MVPSKYHGEFPWDPTNTKGISHVEVVVEVEVEVEVVVAVVVVVVVVVV